MNAIASFWNWRRIVYALARRIVIRFLIQDHNDGSRRDLWLLDGLDMLARWAGDPVVSALPCSEMLGTLNAYQIGAIRTCSPRYLDRSIESIEVCALAVAGEAGEVADLVKKWIAQGRPLSRNDLALELGDVLWGVAVLGHRIGLSLDHIASMNRIKLINRFPNGPRRPDAPTLPEWIS